MILSEIIIRPIAYPGTAMYIIHTVVNDTILHTITNSSIHSWVWFSITRWDIFQVFKHCYILLLEKETYCKLSFESGG